MDKKTRRNRGWGEKLTQNKTNRERQGFSRVYNYRQQQGDGPVW